MALWRIYYHIVWATKERQNLILPEQETQLYNYIIGKSDEYGCIVHAVNGMSDHIHLIISIPPTILVSEYVRKIKGSSSNFLNKIGNDRFLWQHGYGVFTVGVKNLEIAINYVNNQKEHHRQNTTIVALETTKDTDDPPQRIIKFNR
jgi:putative transposase